MNHLLKFRRSEKGQAMVEFALVFPLLMALILGMVEFGWILNGKITLTSAAREGARAAVVCEDAATASARAEEAVLKASEASSLKEVTSVTNFDITAERAVVNVNAKITPIIGLYVSGDFELNAKAEMKIE